jgi:DNA-binding MarR family transcriptional regulator
MNVVTKNLKRGAGDLLEGFELQAFVPYLLNQAMSRLDNNLRIALKPFDLSIHQWRVLFMVRFNGAVSIGDISAGTVMGQSTITRVADQLEAAGLARRDPMKNNNRVVLLSLTEKGEAVIDQVIPVVFAIHDGAIDGLNATEQQQLFHILQKLTSNLKRHEAKQQLELVDLD